MGDDSGSTTFTVTQPAAGWASTDSVKNGSKYTGSVTRPGSRSGDVDELAGHRVLECHLVRDRQRREPGRARNPGRGEPAASFPAPAVSGGASITGPQLSTNPQFTGAATTGWTGFNGTLTGSASPPAGCPEATAAQYVNGGTSAAIEGTIWWAALPSTAYTFSAWVYTTSPNVQIGFNWENAAAPTSATP